MPLLQSPRYRYSTAYLTDCSSGKDLESRFIFSLPSRYLQYIVIIGLKSFSGIVIILIYAGDSFSQKKKKYSQLDFENDALGLSVLGLCFHSLPEYSRCVTMQGCANDLKVIGGVFFFLLSEHSKTRSALFTFL